MPALTQDQKVYIRKQTGSSPADADLQAVYDRLGNVDLLILEVLELRLADLIASPATFAVGGEYSQSTAKNIDELKAKVDAWRAYVTSIGLDAGPVVGVPPVGIVPPAHKPWR